MFVSVCAENSNTQTITDLTVNILLYTYCYIHIVIYEKFNIGHRPIKVRVKMDRILH